MTQTCRFGVRRYPNGGSELCFEVVDRMTGTAVASGMHRTDAEAEARRRNHDASGQPAEMVALLAAIDAYLSHAGHHSRRKVAEAAQALDELRDEFARMQRVIAEQQTRIGQLYKLFPDPNIDVP